jgi:3-hydroxyisobutyrate dehydrogenase-like beta-hydroxyacid dehydrogenase
MAKVAVFGLGAVELPMALTAIAAGHQAISFDRLRRRYNRICVTFELAVFAEDS